MFNIEIIHTFGKAIFNSASRRSMLITSGEEFFILIEYLLAIIKWLAKWAIHTHVLVH